MPFLSIILAFVKPVIGFAFGTPKAAKWTMIILAVISLGGIVWYLTNQYASVKLENVQYKNANEKFAETEKALQDALTHQAKAINDQQNAFKKAIDSQQLLQDEIIRIKEESINEQTIFNRKSKSFQQMLNRRGKKILELSNAGTERVRLKWTSETSAIIDRLREGSRGLSTSSSDTKTESSSMEDGTR